MIKVAYIEFIANILNLHIPEPENWPDLSELVNIN